MRKTNRATVIVTTFIGLIITSRTFASPPVFTPEQQARIGEIAAAYLVAHPDILVTVSQQLQAKQRSRQQLQFALKVMENQQALLHDANAPSTGPDDARVAVIEFFDYQCIHCSRLAPEMEKVMEARKDVRYVFREWPIFAGRWVNSRKAAENGMAIWNTAGGSAYLRYHNGIYRTGHVEGDLTETDIRQATAAALGGTSGVLKQTDADATLEKNSLLAQALGLTGTCSGSQSKSLRLAISANFGSH